MKSRLKECAYGEALLSDQIWKRAEFDFDELMNALAKNDVRSLVVDILHEYKGSRLFAQLVHDVTTSIMLGVVSMLSRTEHHDLVVLIKQSLFDKANIVFHNDGQYRNLSAYWCGENCAISEET